MKYRKMVSVTCTSCGKIREMETRFLKRRTSGLCNTCNAAKQRADRSKLIAEKAKEMLEREVDLCKADWCVL